MFRFALLGAFSIFLASLSLVDRADAQQARSGGGNVNAQALQQMQQLASERTELQAQNAKLQKDLDDVRKERDALKAGQQTLEHRAQASEAAIHQAQASVSTQRETNEQEINKWKSQLEQVVLKFRETTSTLQTVESDRNGLKQQLAAKDKELGSCVDTNMSLYKLNVEILDKLGRPSILAGMGRVEPFTQIKRTQLDNMVVEYRQRADAQRVESKATN